MKKYFIHNGSTQHGPYDLDELKKKNINKDTPIWSEGIPEWTTAGQLDELSSLFLVTPPSLSQNPPVFKGAPVNEKSRERGKSKTALYAGLTIGALAIVVVMMMVGNNPNAIPG